MIRKRPMGQAVTLIAALMFVDTRDLPQTGPPPAPAASAGYNNRVFFDDFSSIDTIDVKATNKPGYKWYATHWFGGFGGVVTPPGNISISSSGLTLGGNAGGAIASIETAIASPVPPFYIGTVFAHGAYSEASIAFDPSLGASAGSNISWPAFWSMAIEHVYDSYHQADEQWPGQAPGYAHFAELDFMEAFHTPYQSYAGRTNYVGTIHDWSGTYNNRWAYDIYNSNNGFNVGAVDWNKFHIYGCLWVPESKGNPGRAQWFFDNQPGPTVYWRGPIGNPPLPGQPPPGSKGGLTASTPEKATATFAIIDQQRLPIILFTDPAWPIRVQWVKVWQT